MDQIIYFKLFNGEDVVATLLEETEDRAVITNPLIIKTILNPITNMMMSGFYSWIPIKEIISCKFQLNKSNILAMVEVPEDVTKAYYGYLENSNRDKTDYIDSDEDSENEEEESEDSENTEELFSNIHGEGNKTIH